VLAYKEKKRKPTTMCACLGRKEKMM